MKEALTHHHVEEDDIRALAIKMFNDYMSRKNIDTIVACDTCREHLFRAMDNVSPKEIDIEAIEQRAEWHTRVYYESGQDEEMRPPTLENLNSLLPRVGVLGGAGNQAIKYKIGKKLIAEEGLNLKDYNAVRDRRIMAREAQSRVYDRNPETYLDLENDDEGELDEEMAIEEYLSALLREKIRIVLGDEAHFEEHRALAEQHKQTSG